MQHNIAQVVAPCRRTTPTTAGSPPLGACRVHNVHVPVSGCTRGPGMPRDRGAPGVPVCPGFRVRSWLGRAKNPKHKKTKQHKHNTKQTTTTNTRTQQNETKQNKQQHEQKQNKQKVGPLFKVGRAFV